MTNFKKDTPLGTLWIAATTLGDLRDIPPRSLELMRSCHLLIFEEDKRARQFLKAAQIHRQWLRYTEQREQFTLEELERELLAGRDALYMSDQGTPGLADPGLDLVKLAYKVGAIVRCVPGPSSLTAAISVCPFDCRRFEFAGFAPRGDEERDEFIRRYLDHQWPVVLFETPYRMRAFFETLASILKGSDRKIFVAIDISGPQETFFISTAQDVMKKLASFTDKPNFVVIIEGTGIEPFKSKRKDPTRHSGHTPTERRTHKSPVNRFKHRHRAD